MMQRAISHSGKGLSDIDSISVSQLVHSMKDEPIIKLLLKCCRRINPKAILENSRFTAAINNLYGI